MESLTHRIPVFSSVLLILASLVFNGCENDNKVVPKALEEYMADLSAIIAKDKPLVENCVVGYNKYDFKSGTYYVEYTQAYLDVLLDAEAVLADPEITITDVVEANKALANPGDNFHDNIWISDRRPLHELIVYCDTLRVHTPIGNEPGMAPEQAHLAFEAAINEAKGVRGRSTTIERQVIEAVDKLDPALDTFEEAIIK